MARSVSGLRCRGMGPIVFGCFRIVCWAMPGRNGFGPERWLSSGSIARRPTNWASIATDTRRNLSAIWAGLTIMVRAPPCSCCPTAISRLRAWPGNRTGYGSRWHQQQITAPERSGLYYFHAKTASGEFFSFPWIVEPARPAAKTAVLTSNITWNAYNSFGGRSNYVNQDGLPARPTLHARQDLRRFTEPGAWPYETTSAPLSFDRPEVDASVGEEAQVMDPIEGRLDAVMAPGEWRLLGWLEREGFALRSLLGNRAALRESASRELSRPGAEHASGILVEGDVFSGQALGLRRGRPADVSRRLRAARRGRVPR